MTRLFFGFIFNCLLFCSHCNADLKVAVLGTGARAGQLEAFNAETLTTLLKKIKEEKPDVIFYTGNLILNLEQKTNPESIQEFKENLNLFSSIVKAALGDGTPLYPVMGNHTFVNSQAVSIFREHFKIRDTAPLDTNQLAYSVNIKNVHFVILATGNYEKKFRGYGDYTRSMSLLDWLEKDLKSSLGKSDFRIAIGHEPAFSSGATEGIYTGIDKDAAARDLFWSRLKENDVRAYFSSHELLYDRSNRGGVWQMVSGGIEDRMKSEKEDSTLKHYVILHIPNSSKEIPKIKAIDMHGKIWDEFDMMPVDRPVHHLRISHK